jgi:hypothetical protein
MISKLTPIEEYLVGNIKSDGTIHTTIDHLKLLKYTFRLEYGWKVEKVGRYEAFKEWIMGLPSVLTIEFENEKIEKLMVEWGFLKDPTDEDQCYHAHDDYWEYMTRTALSLIDRALLPEPKPTPNIHRDTIYIHADHTFEFWEDVTNDHLFVIENCEGLYFYLYPTIQAWHDHPDKPTPITNTQYDNMESEDIIGITGGEVDKNPRA